MKTHVKPGVLVFHLRVRIEWATIPLLHARCGLQTRLRLFSRIGVALLRKEAFELARELIGSRQ